MLIYVCPKCTTVHVNEQNNLLPLRSSKFYEARVSSLDLVSALCSPVVHSAFGSLAHNVLQFQAAPQYLPLTTMK